MKKRLLVFSFLMIPLVLAATPVTFLIENIGPTDGKIFIGVYQEDGFLKRGKQLKECFGSSEAKDNQARIMCDLKPGRYAAAVFHDENSNNKFDTNFLGFPKEGYGLTNNPNNRFSIPSFEETSFIVKGRSRKLKINMMY